MHYSYKKKWKCITVIFFIKTHYMTVAKRSHYALIKLTYLGCLTRHWMRTHYIYNNN